MKKIILLLFTLLSLTSFAQTVVRMSATATGTDTYSCLFNPNVAAFNSSTIYVIPFTNANTSGTITLDPDGGGPGAAVSIKGDDGNDLSVGTIKAGGTYQFKFNGTLLRMIGSASGGNFWKNVGTTTLTGRTAILGSGNSRLHFGMDLSDTPAPLDRFIAYADTVYLGSSTVGNEIAFEGNNVTHTNASGNTGFTNSNGIWSTTALNDVDLESTSGGVHITTNTVSRFKVNNNGSWSVGGSTGTATHVLTSNGAGAAPTWQAGSTAATEYTISTETTSYTLDAGDKTAADGGAKLYFIMDSATGVNFTVPADATVNFAIGTEIIVQRAVNTGQITFVEGGAANITPSAGNLLDAGQSISMSLVKTAANEWVLQNGSTAGQFVDYTTTFSGFSVNPTSVTSRFSLVGKICFVYILCGGDGTSNATTFTLTLPLPPRNNEAQITNFTTNNTLTLSTPGRIVWTAGSTTATLSRDMAGTAWTASGGKRANISLFYEIQ
jgi:hypothetical protein